MTRYSSSTLRAWLVVSIGAGLVLAACQTGQVFKRDSGPNPNQRTIQKYQIPASEEPHLSSKQLTELVRNKIKYVFVIYQENRSFDSYFGTYPGADGIFSRKPEETPGFTQPLVDTDGTTVTIQPFRIGPAEYAADTDDVDHSHPMLVAKMDLQGGAPKMDHFALAEEHKYMKSGNPSLLAKQMGELTLAYEDCDTVPLLWQYASRFVLFDHVFQEMAGPSTLGNLSIIAAQTGQTQWALHPDQAYQGDGSQSPGVPVMNDDGPVWGSPLDQTPGARKMPVNPQDFGSQAKPNTQINLTFATLPLTLQGKQLNSVANHDWDPGRDLADVRHDITFISQRHQEAISFGWYQEGYGSGNVDMNAGPQDASGLHAAYITHHNGPQYFGYIANNPQMRGQLHGLHAFFDALKQETLPGQGGVFFVKGGYENLFNIVPTDPDRRVQKNFKGDDDHPAYSDAQISETLVAQAVNAIAASRYWPESAIIITWDDSEGDYDHVPPPVRAKGPDGSVISDGPRVPLIFISPYARTHYVAHSQGNHASVVKFVDAVFHLPPLALLPDEQRGRRLGEKEFGQKDLGPEDAITSGIGDLTEAFSSARLLGKAEPLPASYVEIPDSLVQHLPQETGYGCEDLGIITTDRQLHVVNKIPSDFNPRPKTTPTL